MPIRLERRGPAVLVVIDREEKANSLDYEHARQLAERIREACRDPQARAVILRGAGTRYFSAGVDLESVYNARSPGEAWRLMAEGLAEACRALSQCEKPVIAAVNGYAIGIGFELLHATDIAIAVRTARLGTPAVRWGMVPPATPTVGPWLYGYKRAALLVLTGRLITAEEAEKWGIINKTVETHEELDREAQAIAEEIARNDPWAVSLARRLLQAARPEPLIERGILALAHSTARPEVAERVKSFLNKRIKNN